MRWSASRRARTGADLPCTDDPEPFFAESPDEVETAKALCDGCPARAACLAGALERREPWGVWRAVNAPHLVALVRVGATFIAGELVERPDRPTETTASQEAA